MIINSIVQFIHKNALLEQNSTIIIGLSGGPDSVFLTHFFSSIKKDYNLQLIAAHLDHEWRKSSSDDLMFCAELCKTLDIPFVSRKASELDIEIKNIGSQEALGRKLRRFFLQEVKEEYNAHAIALAHHEQDQQETFFIRLIRGSTLSGLLGMRPKSGPYIRPLLQTSKKDILEYLHTHNIAYVTDMTNFSESYLRNRIRLNVLPELQKADARFDANFLRTLESLQKAEQFLQTITHATYQESTSKHNNTLYLSIQKLLALDDYLQKRILLHWLIEHNVPFEPTEALLDEIMRFIQNKKSISHALHTTWIVNKKENNLYISKL